MRYRRVATRSNARYWQARWCERGAHTGWKPGLKKISLATLLVKRLNVSIAVAKKYVDDLGAGEVIAVEIDSGSASDFVRELEQLGVICQLMNRQFYQHGKTACSTPGCY